MGVYIDWIVRAKNVTIPEFNKILKDYAEPIAEGCDCVTFFYTENISAIKELREMFREYSKNNPSAMLTVYLKGDGDDCPDKWLIKNGEIEKYVANIRYKFACYI